MAHIERMTVAQVELEHPKGWTDEQLQAAVEERQIDIANAAPYWSGSTKTTLGEIDRGARIPVPDDHPGVEPFRLTEDEE